MSANPTQQQATSWGLPNPAGSPADVKRALHYKYQADVSVPKYALKDCFSVCFYVGAIPPVEYEPINDRYLAGSFDVFASNIETTSCENCRDGAAEDVIVTGSIPLNLALVECLGDTNTDPACPKLKSMKLEHVRGFLKEHLAWRVQLPSGKIPEKAVRGLKIGVSYVVADVPDSDRELPEYSEPENLYDVTKERAPYGISEGQEV